jgi:hypothetical protein
MRLLETQPGNDRNKAAAVPFILAVLSPDVSYSNGYRGIHLIKDTLVKERHIQTLDIYSVRSYEEAQKLKGMSPFDAIPEDFDFPAIVIWEEADSGKHVKRHKTPYGFMPRAAITPDRKFYQFQTYYFLTQSGKALRYVGISDVTEGSIEFMMEVYEEDENDFLHLDFIPDESHSGFTRLDEDDYAHLLKVGNDVMREKYSVHRSGHQMENDGTIFFN